MSAPQTIYDIATRAGVGIATVSRVLNGSSKVGPQTRRRVEQAMRELDYRPNRAARRLATGGPNRPRVAALMPFFSAAFYYAISRPLASGLAQADIDLVLCNVASRTDKQRFLDRIVAERSAEGVVLGSMGIGPDRQAQLKRLGIPVVSIEFPLPGIPTVSVDNLNGCALAARHLVACGAKRLGLIGGPVLAVPFRLREEGFRTVAGDDAAIERATEVSPAAGAKAAAALLKADAELDGIVCVNDLLAVGAIEELARRQRRVPEDVQVIGFDDLPLMDVLGLTTVRQPMSEFGDWAARAIAESIARPGVAVASQELDLTLIPRRTSRAARPRKRQVR